MTKADEINKLYHNQAICVPIDSEDAKCHPDLGDGRRSYKDNDYMLFKHGEQWYFIPEADKHGNNRTLDRTSYKKLETIFGEDNVIQIKDLPSEEV